MCKAYGSYLHPASVIGRLAHFFVLKIIIHLNKGNYYGCNYG